MMTVKVREEASSKNYYLEGIFYNEGTGSLERNEFLVGGDLSRPPMLFNHPLSRTLHTDPSISYQVGLEEYTNDQFLSHKMDIAGTAILLIKYQNKSPFFSNLGDLLLNGITSTNAVFLKLFNPIPGTSALAYTATNTLESVEYYTIGIITIQREENTGTVLKIAWSNQVAAPPHDLGQIGEFFKYEDSKRIEMYGFGDWVGESQYNMRAPFNGDRSTFVCSDSS